MSIKIMMRLGEKERARKREGEGGVGGGEDCVCDRKGSGEGD